MQTVHTVAELRARVAAWKRAGERVAVSELPATHERDADTQEEIGAEAHRSIHR